MYDSVNCLTSILYKHNRKMNEYVLVIVCDFVNILNDLHCQLLTENTCFIIVGCPRKGRC